MDPWGSIILVANFLLLVAGWVLFQQAKSDLNSRAAEAPVLAEVKALQKSVAALIEQLKLESTQTSAQLEARCIEARDLLAALDRKLEETKQSPRAANRRREAVVAAAVRPVDAPPEVQADQQNGHPGASRYTEVYSLADEGRSAAEIAQQTGLTEGEIELIISLRQSAA